MATYKYPSSNLSFSQTVTKVAGDNSLKNANSIIPGQTISLPDGSTVTVQKGDTLSGIVDKWKTNAETQSQPSPQPDKPPAPAQPVTSTTAPIAVTPAANTTSPPAPAEQPQSNDENAPVTEEKPSENLKVDSPNTGSNKVGPIRPNPLSKYSSSTYNISLYMINPDNFNLYSEGGQTIPKDWKLICRSGGINNSGDNGGGPGSQNWRAPGFDLDYYIDNLRISTAISSKETYSASNVFDISFQIHEPYGFSFPTKLVKAAARVQAESKIQRSVNESITALQTHYLLVIKFYGYDSKGNVISEDDYQRSFPIQIYGFDFKLDPKMVTYNVKAKLVSEQIAMGKSKLEIPENITIKGETVKDALQGSDSNNKNPNAIGLMQRLNEIQDQLFKDEQLLVKDKYIIKFESNTGIDTAFLVDVDNNPNEKSANTSVSSADGVNVKTSSKPPVIQKRTRPISVNKGDSILQVIDQIISQSSYVTRALKITTSEEFQQVKPQEDDYTTNTPNTIGWYSVIPQVKLLEFDKKRNVHASEITYIIKRYEVPYIRGLQLGKRTPYYGPVKRYKHWFMSNDLDKENPQHQKEIISYDVTYNLLYFNLAGYGTDAPLDETDDKAPVANLAGGSNPQGKAPGYFDKAIGPFKTFLYSPADQLKAKIIILGDPDYLMTSTTKGYQEAITKWFGTDQSINPNSGQVFIEIDFRDAEDYSGLNDKNAGLLNPSQDGDILFWKYPDDIKKDVQGTIYMVWQVVSTFSRGVFQQELKVCIPPFVSDKPAANSENAENAREIDSLVSRYPAPAPTEFDTVATTNSSDKAMSSATFNPGGASPNLQVSDLGPLSTTVTSEKPESSFNVANDDKMFLVNNNAINEGGREDNFA
jgi:hypothetical protein